MPASADLASCYTWIYIHDLFPRDALIQTICSFTQGSDLSAITSLYILSRLLQVVGGRSMINNVAGVILYHVLNLNARTLSEGNASDSSGVISIPSWCIVLHWRRNIALFYIALRSHNVSQENDQDLDPMDILPRGHVLFV